MSTLLKSPPWRGAARIGLPAALALLAACASTPPPNAQLAVTTAALSHAVGAGAAELAPAEMGLARDKVARANTALASRDNERAQMLLEQAQLDAQLAEAKAEAAKARGAVEALQQASQALREEMARKAVQPKP